MRQISFRNSILAYDTKKLKIGKESSEKIMLENLCVKKYIYQAILGEYLKSAPTALEFPVKISTYTNV